MTFKVLDLKFILQEFTGKQKNTYSKAIRCKNLKTEATSYVLNYLGQINLKKYVYIVIKLMISFKEFFLMKVL